MRSVDGSNLSANGRLCRVTTTMIVLDMLSPHGKSRRIAPASGTAARTICGTRWWIVAGGDVFVLSRILGHSDVATTTAHYAGLLQDDLKAKMLSVMQPAAT